MYVAYKYVRAPNPRCRLCVSMYCIYVYIHIYMYIYVYMYVYILYI